MSSNCGRRYTREFRLNASRLVVEGGYSCHKAAHRLGVSTSTLAHWVRDFRASGDLPQKDEKVPIAEELKELRREVSELRTENEILKKAAAYFAKESL